MKTISERLKETITDLGYGENYLIRQAMLNDVIDWLEQQPENKQMFTLEQVEAIAKNSFTAGWNSYQSNEDFDGFSVEASLDCYMQYLLNTNQNQSKGEG